MVGSNGNPAGGGGSGGRGEFWQHHPHRHHHHHHHHRHGQEGGEEDASDAGHEGESNNAGGNPNDDIPNDGHLQQQPPANNNPAGDGGGGHVNNQQIVMDDGDENDDDDENDDVGENAGDGVIDGGVAVGSDGNAGDKRRSGDCDLILLIECAESLQNLSPGNPLLKKSATVSIGLSDKTTKLSAVFARYCKVVNSSCPGRGIARTEVQPSELEFYHCCLLSGSDTAEASALMKNDRIKVRRVRADEREAEAERRRLQRESDRDYFAQLRFLLPDLSPVGANCDVMLDCRGKLVDENGYNQEVLTTAVRAHSALVSKRCPWLGRIIQCAREEMKRKAVITIPENGVDQGRGRMVVESASSSPAVARIASNASSSNGDDDEAFIEMMPSPSIRSSSQAGGRPNNIYSPRAAEVEDDDDENGEVSNCVPVDGVVRQSSRSGSPIISNASGSNSMLWVTLPDHPPEAVKLLLEYCYTNRVIPLGCEAFFQAGKMEELPGGGPQHHGPVPPRFNNSAGWPDNGEPTVSLQVALAGIQLAEEACMPRLSLMCECAAAQLVTRQSILEVLSLCTLQEERTGNRLPILRKATMVDHVLGNGPRGVSDLCRMPTFQRTLEERRALVVPSLLMGTMEVLPAKVSSSGAGGLFGGGSHGRRRDSASFPRFNFDDIDKEDEYARDLERKKWRVDRKRRRNPDYDGTIEDEEDDRDSRLYELMPDSLAWCSTVRSQRVHMLKRMANQQHRGVSDVFAFGGVTSDSRSAVVNRREYSSSGGGGSGGRHGHVSFGGRRSGSSGRGGDSNRRSSRNRRSGSLSSK